MVSSASRPGAPRPPLPAKILPDRNRRSLGIPGELTLVAILIGFGTALLGKNEKGSGAATGAARTGMGSGDRGRHAERPSEIPAKGWKDIAWRLLDAFQNDRVLLVAAGVTFYALLALFPATAAVVTLYGLVTDASTINQHLQSLSGFLPEGALEVIGDQTRRITSKGQGALGLTLLGTLALSIWGANAGTKSIFDALNIIYKEEEKRGFIGVTLRSLAFTLGAILLVLFALVGIVVVPVTLELLGIPSGSGAALLSLLRWPVLYLFILFALACLYRYGPSRAHPQWRWVTWGSAIAGAVWIVGSLLLSWYVSNFGTYNATYGSLGAVVGFMVWMWLSTVIVLAGAEINAEMEHQTARDTTEGGRKPLGARGATMADEVGHARA